jgi:hypothetical protein
MVVDDKRLHRSVPDVSVVRTQYLRKQHSDESKKGQYSHVSLSWRRPSFAVPALHEVGQIGRKLAGRRHGVTLVDIIKIRAPSTEDVVHRLDASQQLSL